MDIKGELDQALGEKNSIAKEILDDDKGKVVLKETAPQIIKCKG